MSETRPGTLKVRRTRRLLLGYAGTLAGASAVQATIQTLGYLDRKHAAVDPHPAWWERHETLRAWINDPTTHTADEETEGPFEELIGLEDLIAVTPAATLVGVRVQVGLAHHNLMNSTAGAADERALETALAALERLSGSAAHG